MKNNENLFADFVALAAIARITKAFSEKEQNDRAKKSNAEKPCECKCKNQQNFNKEILGKVRECKETMCLKTLDRDIKIYQVLENMENKLMARLSITESKPDKSDTEKSYKREEKSLTAEEIAEKVCNSFEECTKCEISQDINGYTEIVCGGYLDAGDNKINITQAAIDKAFERGITGDQIIYLPKEEKEKIIKEIDKCFGIINKNSDEGFRIIAQHLGDILCILAQYK